MNAEQIRPVEAFLWACPDCHDTGLAPLREAAAADLVAHREDYH